jgi:hypothetical protein
MREAISMAISMAISIVARREIGHTHAPFEAQVLGLGGGERSACIRKGLRECPSLGGSERGA